MALDLFRLFVFMTVVDRNGYSAAARHLRVAQPTVSHHVSELEKALGAELLRYEQQRVHLTPAGQEVYRAAGVMLREQDHLTQSLADMQRGRRGRVRLAATMAFEQKYFFDHAIVPFRRANEGVWLSVRFGHSRREAQAVLDREVDLAYVIKWQLPPDAQFECLHPGTLSFLVAPTHPLAERETVTVAEIAAAGLITAPYNDMESSFYHQLLQESGLDGSLSVLEVDGLQGRVFAAEAGLGVLATVYPAYVGVPTAGSLVPLSVDGPSALVEVGLVTRPGDTLAEPVEALADWLRKLTAE